MIVENQTLQEDQQHIEIRVGDDYLDAYQRAFTWIIKNRSELEGGSAELAIDGIVIATGSVTAEPDDEFGNTVQKVQIEVADVQSALLVNSVGLRRRFSVQITISGDVMVEISGTADVSPAHP